MDEKKDAGENKSQPLPPEPHRNNYSVLRAEPPETPTRPVDQSTSVTTKGLGSDTARKVRRPTEEEREKILADMRRKSGRDAAEHPATPSETEHEKKRPPSKRR